MTDQSGVKTLVPSFKISCAGSELTQNVLNDLLSITVQEDVDVPSMFTLRFSTWDYQKLKFTWVDDSKFSIGAETVIEMGYLENQKKLITGEITSIELDWVAQEVPVVVISGYDRRHRLMQGRHTRTFVKMKDSAIASQIASEAGLSATCTDTKVTLDYVMQHAQTDMDFLQERARRIGYEVYLEEKALYFRPHKVSQTAVATLAANDNLIEFFPRLSAASQVSDVQVQGWDAKKKEPIVSKTSSPSSTMGSSSGSSVAKKAFSVRTDLEAEYPVYSKAESDAVAAGYFEERILGFITGEGLCNGNTSIRAGKVVKIDKVGKRFSGDYYVTSTTHTFHTGQGYRTRFTVKRNANG